MKMQPKCPRCHQARQKGDFYCEDCERLLDPPPSRVKEAALLVYAYYHGGQEWSREIRGAEEVVLNYVDQDDARYKSFVDSMGPVAPSAQIQAECLKSQRKP